MSYRAPDVVTPLGLGVGMDLPWRPDKIGFRRSSGGEVAPKVRNFLAKYQGELSTIFFAYQPKDRCRLSLDNYRAAYDSLYEACPDIPVRGFHHTMLNMGAVDTYDPRSIIAFTNALCEQYGFRWIVEDLGIWSIQGKALPYPLPPLLTVDSLKRCIERVRLYQRELAVPLSVEFPGFSEGLSVVIGEMNAYEFFAAVVRESESPATLDTGHLLSYQWMRGKTGAAMFDGLEVLPFDHTFEIHLSGCQITQGKFRDLHHGVLLDEQLDLLEWLIPRCPNLKVVTYEDPQYRDDGTLVRKAIPNYERLQSIAQSWSAAHAA